MQVIRELIDGVVPSHPLTITVDVRVFGVILTLHQLQFKGSHAKRSLWNQSITEGNVIIREQDEKLVAVLNADSWNDTMVFDIVHVHAFIERPTVENARPRDVDFSDEASSESY